MVDKYLQAPDCACSAFLGMNMTNNQSLLVRIPLINLSSHGGVRILVELANTFSRAGWRVEVLHPPRRNNTVYQLDEAVVVREIGIKIGIKLLDYVVFLLLLPFYLRGGVTVANFFVTYLPSRLGTFIWGTPLLYFVQGIEFWYGGIFDYICKLSYRSDRIIAANPYIRDDLKGRGYKVLDTIHIGPSEAFYQSAATSSSKAYQLMVMPRLEPWKRMDRFQEISEILGEIPKSSILCVGQDEEILTHLAKRGFTTCKPKNDTELLACYDQSQIFLLTSDREGFGLPPLEAMARGVPVVSFKCGGPDLYIKDNENSFLVDNVQNAADRIRLLLADASEHERLAINAKETAFHFRLSDGLSKFVASARREIEQP